MIGDGDGEMVISDLPKACSTVLLLFESSVLFSGSGDYCDVICDVM